MSMQPLNEKQEAAYRLALAAAARITGSQPFSVADPLQVDWGYFLYFVDLNGLAGIVQDALSSLPAQQRSLVPFRVLIGVRNQAERYRERWQHYASILEQLDERAHQRLKIVLLKGASFKSTLYRDCSDARVMGDIDLLVSSDCSDDVVSWVVEWGFQTRQSKNGITAIRQRDGMRSVIDIHIDDPAKTKRNPSRAIRTLLDNLVDIPGYASLKMPSFEYSMAHCCKHFCEHKDDFRKILFQDDIKVSRLLDIVLLQKASDAQQTQALAEGLGWQDELVRAQAYASVLGNPEQSVAFEPEPIETQLGALRWPVGFDQLVRRVDRAEWLSAQLGERGSRDLWYSPEKGILDPGTLTPPR